ncbi:hypothetical protein MHK_007442, partial [Candidatus Magnetomorum sp. HK-1]
DVHTLRNIHKGTSTTDSAGYYTIVDLPSISGLIVSAWPPYTQTTYLNQFFDNKETRDAATRISTELGDETEVDFQLANAPTNSIKGRITDGTTAGTPGLANVVVEVYSSILDIQKSVVTDANGNYTLTALKTGTDYVLSVYDDRFQTEFFYCATEDNVTDKTLATKLTPIDQSLDNIDIVIRLTNTITGNVKNDNGKVLGGIWVQAEVVNDSFNKRSALTDEFGNYTLTGLDNFYHYVEILPTAYPYQAYSLSTTRALSSP